LPNFSGYDSNNIARLVCTHHNEIVEQFLFEMLGNFVQVVGDKVMVAVDGDTRRQLQKNKNSWTYRYTV
jgi:hypothetical protein